MKECLSMFMAAVAMFVVSVCLTDYADSPPPWRFAHVAEAIPR